MLGWRLLVDLYLFVEQIGGPGLGNLSSYFSVISCRLPRRLLGLFGGESLRFSR